VTPYALYPARIVARRDDTPDIATFTMRFLDADVRRHFRFELGQFNMVYAYGIGEVPISIVSDPDEPQQLQHTIRLAGRVTTAILRWRVGEVFGVRGPYGVGWPVAASRGRHVVIVTGGLGCAPVVGVIDYIFRRRDYYGDLHILHGVKTPRDLLYRERFEAWRTEPRTRVYLTSDQPDRTWRDRVGVVTELFDELDVEPSAVAFICGPDVMMHHAVRALRAKGIGERSIYLSLERHMQCGVGLCGHCQIGPFFGCKDGPVFQYAEVKHWLGTPGI
jgi:NAD(P)H-flavin reductase